ncbi:hypothetical protein CsSME_00005842 [Camellia sinensis var. sinensis]
MAVEIEELWYTSLQICHGLADDRYDPRQGPRDLGSCCYRHGDLGIFLVFAHRSKVMLFQDLCRYKSMPSNGFFDAVWIVELKESV